MNVVDIFGKRKTTGRSAHVQNTAGTIGEVAGSSLSRNSEEPRDERAESLGRMLVEFRDCMAFTQEQFSEESGVGRTTISKIEAGRLYPSARIRRKLAKAMNLSPADLWQFGRNSADHQPTGSDNNLTDSGRTDRRAAS